MVVFIDDTLSTRQSSVRACVSERFLFPLLGSRLPDSFSAACSNLSNCAP